MTNNSNPTIGWIGTGRMGYAMVSRLLNAGLKVSVYNRTRSKAEPLAAYGADVVDTISELAKCDIVFSMVSESSDLLQVTTGAGGVLSQKVAPKVIIDCSTVSVEASVAVRLAAAERGTKYLVAPVSGNGKVVTTEPLAVFLAILASHSSTVTGLLKSEGSITIFLTVPK